MDKETKQPKKYVALKILAGATALSTLLYFGNAFNLKNHVNQGVSSTRIAVVDVLTKDIGELSTKLYDKVKKVEDINQYKDEIQQMMYAVNDRFAPENQFTTIDGLIERTSPDMQQKITDTTYNKQDSNFKARFTEEHLEDIPYENRVEISKGLVKDIFEKNKSNVRKNMDELWENFNKFYKGLINKFKE